MGRDNDPRFAELYRWKHELNPFGRSPTWVATDGDRIAAVRIFMRWEFLRDGHVVRAVRAVDTATDPDYQGRGLFTALTLHALDEMKADGVAFVFNTPNAQSRPGYLKMGWQEVGRLPVAVRIAGARSLWKVARARVPSDHWSQPLSLGRSFEEWADDGRDWRPSAPLPGNVLATNASEAFFRWRFGLPAMHYRAMEHEGGAVVVRARRRGPALELVQLASFGLSDAQRDRATVAAMRAARADHAIRLGSSDARRGFIALPGGGPILTSRSIAAAGVPPLSNWSLTMGDIELF
jgi:GNAT superfamily N-acetyltransferase